MQILHHFIEETRASSEFGSMGDPGTNSSQIPRMTVLKTKAQSQFLKNLLNESSNWFNSICLRWALMFIFSSEFLWGELDKNTITRALEREREKYIQGRNQDSPPSGRCPNWFCISNLPGYHLPGPLLPWAVPPSHQGHTWTLSQTCCSDWVLLFFGLHGALQVGNSILSQWHPCSTTFLV